VRGEVIGILRDSRLGLGAGLVGAVGLNVEIGEFFGDRWGARVAAIAAL